MLCERRYDTYKFREEIWKWRLKILIQISLPFCSQLTSITSQPWRGVCVHRHTPRRLCPWNLAADHGGWGVGGGGNSGCTRLTGSLNTPSRFLRCIVVALSGALSFHVDNNPMWIKRGQLGGSTRTPVAESSRRTKVNLCKDGNECASTQRSRTHEQSVVTIFVTQRGPGVVFSETLYKRSVVPLPVSLCEKRKTLSGGKACPQLPSTQQPQTIKQNICRDATRLWRATRVSKFSFCLLTLGYVWSCVTIWSFFSGPFNAGI